MKTLIAGTKKIFFYNTYKFLHEATIKKISISPVTPTEKWIVLDETIFHPQGGGQPSDEGEIVMGEKKFKITSLQSEGEEIIHKGNYLGAKDAEGFKVGERVTLKIDEARRRLYARVHSAGHLLDQSFHALGFTNEGIKGCHFPDRANVEFAGKLAHSDLEECKAELQKKINELIRSIPETDPVITKICTYDEASKELKGAMPSYIKPTTPNIRIVKLNSLDLGGPCGGTHVNHIKEIGAVKVGKIKTQGAKSFRISYLVLDPLQNI